MHGVHAQQDMADHASDDCSGRLSVASGTASCSACASAPGLAVGLDNVVTLPPDAYAGCMGTGHGMAAAHGGCGNHGGEATCQGVAHAGEEELGQEKRDGKDAECESGLSPREARGRWTDRTSLQLALLMAPCGACMRVEEAALPASDGLRVREAGRMGPPLPLLAPPVGGRRPPMLA